MYLFKIYFISPIPPSPHPTLYLQEEAQSSYASMQLLITRQRDPVQAAALTPLGYPSSSARPRNCLKHP